MFLVKKVILIFILFLSKNTLGATYYVATTGIDGNDRGSFERPFKTIAYAVNKMVAGDTTYVRGGVYKEPEGIKFGKSGTPSARIRLLNAFNEKPVIDFAHESSRERRVSIVNERGASKSIGWITIEGFEIRNGLVGIHIYNCDDCVFRRNWIHHIVHQGILGNGKNTIIDRSIINHVGVFEWCAQGTSKCNLTHGIYGTGPNWKITNNLIYDNLSYGIVVAGYPNCPEGFCIPGSQYAYVKKYTDDSYGGASGWLIANNTIAYNNYRAAIVLWLPLTTNSKIINNIFYENSQKYSGDNNGVSFVQSPGGGHEIRNNICFATAPGATNCIGSNGQGKYTLSNLIKLNPNFVSAGSLLSGVLNFKLKSGSPAIDKGLPLSTVKFDFLGVSRPQGGAIDIGAYEY